MVSSVLCLGTEAGWLLALCWAELGTAGKGDHVGNASSSSIQPLHPIHQSIACNSLRCERKNSAGQPVGWSQDRRIGSVLFESVEVVGIFRETFTGTIDINGRAGGEKSNPMTMADV